MPYHRRHSLSQMNWQPCGQEQWQLSRWRRLLSRTPQLKHRTTIGLRISLLLLRPLLDRRARKPRGMLPQSHPCSCNTRCQRIAACRPSRWTFRTIQLLCQCMLRKLSASGLWSQPANLALRSLTAQAPNPRQKRSTRTSIPLSTGLPSGQRVRSSSCAMAQFAQRKLASSGKVLFGLMIAVPRSPSPASCRVHILVIGQAVTSLPHHQKLLLQGSMDPLLEEIRRLQSPNLLGTALTS
mmetsp:Transcript_4341/g.7634  ORF Transcript_4341/g.7634 Transcript_4341/m.7634 type:complete len:239 (+) Transcript_4341:511-1227(+)